jgi:Immunity protein 40
MRMSTDYHTLLVDNGIQLGILGLKDISLRRADALYAVELLRTAAIPILGGDVWFRRGGKIESAYANWHTDGKIGEDKDTYLQRTWDSTEQYIREFPVRTDAEPLFVLVTAK